MSKIIQGNNISETWIKVFSTLFHCAKHEISPLVVQIEILPDEKNEISEVQAILDKFLINENERSCNTVADTIFPITLWNRKHNRKNLYNRYRAIWPGINRHLSNRNGTYFQRMIDFNIITDKKNEINQLEHIIITWLKNNHRRSALQVSIFDPRTDHSHSRRKEFPCLQQLAFNPLGRNGINGLEVIAFYANQTIVEKAYGNYLGLYHLGLFMAHEMKLSLRRVTCISSVAKLTLNKSISKLQLLLKKIE